jgi:hypothetical protein
MGIYLYSTYAHIRIYAIPMYPYSAYLYSVYSTYSYAHRAIVVYPIEGIAPAYDAPIDRPLYSATGIGA